jgi:hypothetical protein
VTTRAWQPAPYCTSRLRALSYRFAVRSDDRELGRHVEKVLAGLREPATAPPVEHWYSLTPSADGTGRVDVRRDGADVALDRWPSDAVGWVVRDVNRTAAEASSEHLLLHAGALEASGTGVLVPGSSGSGKSTLVAGLARAGLSYLTDELAALDLSSGHLQPYAKPITIKRGSFDVLGDMHPCAEADPLVGRGSGGEWQVPVGPGTSRAIGRPCAPGIVVVPRYDRGATTALTPLTDTEAFLYLALNAVNLRSHGGAGTAALGKLITSCTCVALTMSDLDAACVLVLGLVEEHTVRVEAGVGAHAG